MMTDMCLRIDGLPHDTWGYTLLPFAFPLSRRPLVQGEQWAELHYPGCRFACPGLCARWAFSPLAARTTCADGTKKTFNDKED